MGDELKAVEDWAKIFTNPSELVKTVTKHFAFHKAAIQADLAAVESDWKAGLQFKAGVDLADLLTLAIGPIELPAVEFVEGPKVMPLFGFPVDEQKFIPLFGILQ